MTGTKPRAHAVDLLRIVASFQMIQGHTLDALLDDELRSGALFDLWTWIRGLTAVAFMTAAGLSFQLATLARIEAHLSSAEAGRRRVRRALMLIVIGYLLHFPAGLFSGDADQAWASLREFAMVDVLQCIGVSILLLEALTRVLRDARRVVMVSVVLAALFVGLAPIAAPLECAGALLPLCNYASRSAGSLFPLWPWSGFIFAGVVAGAIAFPQGAKSDPVRAGATLLGVGALLAALGFGASGWLGMPSAPRVYSASIAFSLQRLGAVLCFTGVLSVASRSLVALPAWLRTLSSETLFLYVTHLLVLYASMVGLSRWVGHTLSLPAAAGVAVALMIACGGGALWWARRAALRV